MDEMRYGLMSNVRRSWSKVGKRTVIENQQAFSSRYCYSAIDPIEGDAFHLMDFKSTTSDEMDLFLTALQESFKEEHLVIVWDNAPSHRSKSLQREDMTLIALPSYSPQLNPVERYFGEMRKVTANQIFRDGMEALSLVVEQGLLKLSQSKEYLQKLCGYDWIIEQWNAILENTKGMSC
jgi:transposase